MDDPVVSPTPPLCALNRIFLRFVRGLDNMIWWWFFFLYLLEASNLSIGKITATPSKAKLKPNGVIFNKATVILRNTVLQVEGNPPHSVEVFRNGRSFARYLNIPDRLDVASGDTVILVWKSKARLEIQIERKNELMMFLQSNFVNRRLGMIVRMAAIFLFFYLFLVFFDTIFAVPRKVYHPVEFDMSLSHLKGSDGSDWVEVANPLVLGGGVVARIRVVPPSVIFGDLYKIADNFLREWSLFGHSPTYPDAIILTPTQPNLKSGCINE